MAIKALEGLVFGSWPTRTERPTTDWFIRTRDRLVDGLTSQIRILGGEAGRYVREGRPWYRLERGVYYCQIRVCGRKMALNDAGETTPEFNCPHDAREFYKGVLEGVLAGEFDEMITRQIETTPPRKKRNQ